MILFMLLLGMFGGSSSGGGVPLDPIDGDAALDILRVRRHRMAPHRGGK